MKEPSKIRKMAFVGDHLPRKCALRGVARPTLTGALPAIYKSAGRTVRALARKNDEAFTLLNACTKYKCKQAILNYRAGDLMLGRGHAGRRSSRRD